MSPRKKQPPAEVGEVPLSSDIFPTDKPDREPLEVKPEPEKGKERLGFAVTVDGKIDWDSMRDQTKTRLKEVLVNSPIPGMEIKREPPFSKETLVMVWSGIGALETLGAIKYLGIPKDIAGAIFPYNEKERDALSDALNKVLAKYDWVNSVKYKEEFDLAGMFLALTTMKIFEARRLTTERRKANGPTREAESAQGTGAAESYPGLQ